MTDHLAAARAAIHAEHGWSMAAPASSLADMAYAIARILDHLEEQRTDASIQRGLDDAAAGETVSLGSFARYDEPEPDPLDGANHADRYDRDGERWVWCGACSGLRLDGYGSHGECEFVYGWSAVEIDEVCGPLTFAPRPADTPTQPADRDFHRWLGNICAEAWSAGFDVGATHGIAYQAGDDNALPQPSTLNPYRKDRS